MEDSTKNELNKDIEKIYTALDRLAVQLNTLREDFDNKFDPVIQRGTTSNAARLVDEIAQTNIPPVIEICDDIIDKCEYNLRNLKPGYWSDNKIREAFEAHSTGMLYRMPQIITYLKGIQTILFNLRNEINTLIYSDNE